MDVQAIVALNLMALSALSIVMSLQQRARGDRLWLAVNAAVIAAGLAGLMADWRWTGVVVAALFVPLVLAPSVLFLLAQKRVMAGRKLEALRYARGAALLHPSRTMRFHAAMMGADALEDAGQRTQALRALAGTASPLERQGIEIAIRRNEDDWGGVLQITRQDQSTQGWFAAYIVRALGELGRPSEMVAAYEAAKSGLAGVNLHVTQLVVLAFGGAREGVQGLLEHQLAALDDEAKSYWRAIAARAAGAGEAEWLPALERLARESPNPTTRAAAARHLASAPTPDAADDAAWKGAVQAIAARLARLPPRSRLKLSAAPGTLVLLVGVLAMFGVEEWAGGSENIDTLARLGAMWPPYVLQREEWWRLGAALFLHAGWLHLGLNALMLLVLGQVCEARLGTWRMLAIFLLGGLASTGGVLWLMSARVIEPAVLVGASGAIFALVGAEVARRIAAWISTRDVLDRRDAVMLALVILVQAVVDLSTPQISFAAHASGFVAGVVLGVLLGAAQRR